MEQKLFDLAGTVVQTGFKRVLAKRRSDKEAALPLSELIASRTSDLFVGRKFENHVESVTLSVAERLTQLCRNEFRDLDEAERAAAAVEATTTMGQIDASDAALFEADMKPELIAKSALNAAEARIAKVGFSQDGRRFYELLVHFTAECLVRLITSLPNYSARVLTEILERSSQTLERVEAAMQRIPVPSLFAPQGTGLDEEFRGRYLRAVSESLDELELFGVDVNNFQARTTLSVAYIGLSVRTNQEPHDPRDPQRWLAERNGEPGEQVVRVEQVLGCSERILIRGEAGSGKSTLLRWLAINAARSGFSADLAALNGMVPVLVKLRSWEGERLPTPEELLFGTAPELAGLMPQGFMHSALEAGRVLLLVDGVDELSASERPKTRKWLAGLLNTFSKNRVVVTSRPSAAAANWLSDEGFAPAMLERMSPADVRELVRHWHLAIRGSTTLPCRAMDLPGYERGLLAKLESSADLRAMATTPLLCAMLCALNLDREQHLPHNRIELYQAALAMLIDRRDTARRVPIAIPNIGQAEKRILLRELAWRLSINQRSELRYEAALDRVSKKLASMPTVDHDASAVLGYLLERSGVIREPQSGRIDFVHRTFQEFLTADQAADNGDMGLLVANAHKDQWQEIVTLAAGLAKRPDRTELVTGLLDRAGAEKRYSRKLRILAASCLETVPDLVPDVHTRVVDELSQLLPPRRESEATALARVGAPLLALLPRSLKELSSAAANATVWAATMVNGSEAMSLLAGFAKDSRYEIQKSLLDAWMYFDPDEYARTVLAEAPLLDGAINVHDHERAAAAKHLRNLQIVFAIISRLDDLSCLDDAPCLHALSVDGNFTSLDPLKRHQELSMLWVYPHSQVDLTPLSRLPKLRELSVELSQSSDLSPLWELTDLSRLSLLGTTPETELSRLPELKGLRHLTIYGSPPDITIVGAMPSLTELRLPQPPSNQPEQHQSSVIDLSGLGDRELSVYVNKNREVVNVGPNIILHQRD